MRSDNTGRYIAEYVWEGGRLIREINPDRTITFLYDGDEVAGFSAGGSNYYYAKDSFGVISYVYNEDGSLYASYKYDAWGSLITSASTLPASGDINPIRYKSYYYDADTGFYYLQSRYYDPFVGRFLNADDAAYLGISGTVLGWNMFAYCENDAADFSDPNGFDAVYFANLTELPVVGHAILFYESGGVWYSTEFIGVTGSLRFAAVQSFFVISSSISLALCGNFAGAFYSLGYIGCTFAGIFREEVGNSYEDVMSKIRQLGHGLYVKLPGNYSYVDGIVKLLTGARTHQIYLYSLFKRNCAHYIEYLLQRSPDCQVRFVVRHQLTPIKLGRDLALRQYFYYFYRMYGIDLIGLGL